MMLFISTLIAELWLAQVSVPKMTLDEYMRMTSEICSDSHMRDYFHPEPGYGDSVLFVQFPSGLKIEGAQNREYETTSNFGKIIFIYKNNRFHFQRMAWFEYSKITFDDYRFEAVFNNFNHIDSKHPQRYLRFKIRAKFTEGRFTSVRIKN